MQARTTAGASAEPHAVRPSRRGRLRARLRGAYEEDGVFRPVRLPLWVDLGVSALIVLAAAASFVGFFAWLAHTQGR